jgi:hypothetical protein
MATETPLVIRYKNDDSWFAQVAPQLQAHFTESILRFNNEIGKGLFYRVDIEPGLRARKIEVCFRRPVVFMRQGTEHPGYYVLVSNLSDQYIETHTQQQVFKLGYGSDNGIYFSSPFLSAAYTFQSGISYHLIFIIITYQRIKDFIARQPAAQQPLLNSIVDKDKPVYHVECLDAHLTGILRDIDSHLNDERPNNLLLHSRTLELCYHILQKVEQRRNN